MVVTVGLRRKGVDLLLERVVRVLDDSPDDTLSGEEPRFSVSLVDTTTGLPALAGVLPTLHQRAEQGEHLGVLYFDLSSEARLESIYGWETYDSLLRQVAQVIRGYLREELRGEDLVAIGGSHGDEFLLFVGLGREAREEALERIRGGVLQRIASRIQVQFDNERPRPVVLHSSASVLRHDPMVRLERTLYRCLDDLRAACRLLREEQLNERLAELRRIVAAEDVEVRFQPIVRLRDGRVHGFEALTCGPAGSIFENPEMLFSFAEGTDHIEALEGLCRAKSVYQARALDSGLRLFLNCSARILANPQVLCQGLLQQAQECGLKATDIVIEITERVAITAWQDFRRSVAALRLVGFRIAIDDVGAGYSSLKSIAEVTPDYLKVDISLVRDVHKSHLKRSLLDGLVRIGSTLKAQVIAEGVENEEEFKALKEMHIDLGQGYFFARPGATHEGLGLRRP